jgi:AcrR family transcriptional regulator
MEPADRLQQLIEAAIRVFTAKGYRLAQMDDIANEMGVSKGTLYNYVESKEALFFLIFDQGFGQREIGPKRKLPIPTPPIAATLRRVRERMLTASQLQLLESALARDTVADPRAELEAIVREFYAVIAEMRHAGDLIERCARDVPQLAELFYVQGRRSLIDLLSRYLEKRIEGGYFAAVPDVPTSARFITESIVWFARHRHNTPDSKMISDEAALTTTVHMLANALVPAAATRARQSESTRSRIRSTGRKR